MIIIEQSIIGKKCQEACEDGLVVTDEFIAVIDGSTSKTPKASQSGDEEWSLCHDAHL